MIFTCQDGFLQEVIFEYENKRCPSPFENTLHGCVSAFCLFSFKLFSRCKSYNEFVQHKFTVDSVDKLRLLRLVHHQIGCFLGLPKLPRPSERRTNYYSSLVADQKTFQSIANCDTFFLSVHYSLGFKRLALSLGSHVCFMCFLALFSFNCGFMNIGHSKQLSIHLSILGCSPVKTGQDNQECGINSLHRKLNWILKKINYVEGAWGSALHIYAYTGWFFSLVSALKVLSAKKLI